MLQFRPEDKMNHLNERRDRRIADANNKRIIRFIICLVVMVIALMVITAWW